GTRTAGQAMITQEYPLRTGQRLRIATSPIQLGDGSALTAKGLQPDITVPVNPTDEAAYFADAFKVLPRTNLFANMSLSLTNPASGTNRPARRPRFNEAELVRERREGLLAEGEPTKESEPEKPLVTDPVLARALDVLKGLALVRQSRS
ncbi:MAG TPA: hypothetical protein VNZ22_20100, partial [Bacillota bacterium]|nr:hypothetical protein [Bacillota bacterium]